MSENRSYPDISFTDTDTQSMIERLTVSCGAYLGRTLAPADPMNLIILWIADILVQERVLIDWAAKQNIPRYAEGEYLDSVAEIFKDAFRQEEAAARTTFRCYVTVPPAFRQLIPADTRITVDGNITFATTEDLYIGAGEYYGDVEGICETAGVSGNGFLPGQITTLVDLYANYDKVENITSSAGGAERETDAEFYERMRLSMESYSTAGPVGAYEYLARTASSVISDAKATSPAPDYVDVRILCDGGTLPPPEIIKLVYDKLTDGKTTPMTDNISVGAPDTHSFDVILTYYITTPNASSAAIIEADVNAAVEEYISWQTSIMGRDINPSYLNYLVMKTGVKRVDILAPAYTILPRTTVATLGGVTINNGGVEDD